MFLSRIRLNPRCREARRDLFNPYELHSTLCRAFCEPEQKCPPSTFLWRVETSADPRRSPNILVQSRAVPDWTRISVRDWLDESDPTVDLEDKLGLDSLESGGTFRFRLRANPCVTRDGRRRGLTRVEEQEEWIEQKAKQHGFSLPRMQGFDLVDVGEKRPDVRISEGKMLRGRKRKGDDIQIYSAQFDGLLTVVDTGEFRKALQTGIGHGKSMGLGLLSVVPVAKTQVVGVE